MQPAWTLSPREYEIVTLIASGMTQQEIASVLSRSLHTVQFHVNNIHIKTGARTVVQMLRACLAAGVLSVDALLPANDEHAIHKP